MLESFWGKVLFALVVIVAVGFGVWALWLQFFLSPTPSAQPTASPKTPIEAMQQAVKNLEQIPSWPRSLDLDSFLSYGKNFITKLERMEKIISSKDWAVTKSSVVSLKGDLESMEQLRPRLEEALWAEGRVNIGDYFSSAKSAIIKLEKDIDNNLKSELDSSLPSLQELQDKRKALEEANGKLKTENQELQNKIDENENKVKAARQARQSQVMALVGKGLPWLGLSLLIGFAMGIPWYKRFADEENFYRFSAETGRLSPINIMLYASAGMAVILVGYILLRGYLSVLF